MLLADGDSGIRFGPAEITIVGVLLSSVVGAMGIMFKLLMAAKDQALVDCKAERDNYRSVASDATRLLLLAETKIRDLQGKPPNPVLAAVVPEHQSPVTSKESIIAHTATLRAAVTAVALELGEPARKEEDKTGVVEAAKMTVIVAAETVKKAEKQVEDQGKEQAKEQP